MMRAIVVAVFAAIFVSIVLVLSLNCCGGSASTSPAADAAADARDELAADVGGRDAVACVGNGAICTDTPCCPGLVCDHTISDHCR